MPCRAGEPAMGNTSEGSLLGGRVRYRQPEAGFRSGIEPVLLAAVVPATPAARVLEAGTGAGAGLLCLAARVPGVRGIGVERDPALAALAGWNFVANGFTALTVVAADIDSPEPGLIAGERFDHAFANPPWHPATGTAPGHPARTAAKRGGEELGAWVAALAGRLRPRGTLSLVLPAAQVPQALAAAAAAHSGAPLLFPLWPKQGRAAKLVLLRVTRGARGPFRLLAGLVLHREDGRFTEAAEAILRDGAALDI